MRNAMAARYALPFLLLAALVLPLPFAVVFFVLSVPLAARPRGEPRFAPAAVLRPQAPALLRGPPR